MIGQWKLPKVQHFLVILITKILGPPATVSKSANCGESLSKFCLLRPNKVEISCNQIYVAQPTREVVQNCTSPHQDIISEERNHYHDSTENMPSDSHNAEKKLWMMNITIDSTEDMPPVPPRTEKKPCRTKNAPRKALIKQHK